VDLDAYRRWGYLEARLDSLGRLKTRAAPELEPPSEEARRWYCGSIGIEFMHLQDARRRRFLQERIERPLPHPDPAPILDLLVRCDTSRNFSSAATWARNAIPSKAGTPSSPRLPGRSTSLKAAAPPTSSWECPTGGASM
jgi:hypothetical protein